MNTDILQGKRWHIALPLLLLQLWPVHIVFRAYTSVPQFKTIFMDLLGDKPLPAITQLVLNTYHYWIVIPLITTCLSGFCFSRRVTSMTMPVITLIVTILVCYILSFLLAEGMFAPLMFIINSLAK